MKKLFLASAIGLSLLATAVSADTYLESVGTETVGILPNAVARGNEVGTEMSRELGPLGAILGGVLGFVGGAVEGVGKTSAAVIGFDA